MFRTKMGFRTICRAPEDGGGSGGGDGGNGGGDAGGANNGQGGNSGGDGGDKGGDANKGGGADQSQQRQQESKFELPEAYREKPHFKNFKSVDDVYKALDGAQELIGKKTIAPIDYATATPEQIAEYHSKLAPTDKSAYKFAETADKEFSGAVADALQKAGLSEYQGNQVIKMVEEVATKFESDYMKAQTSPETYNKAMKDAFGDDAPKAAKFLDTEIYGKHLDEAQRKVLNKLPSAQLAIVDQAVYKTSQAYEARIAAILKEHGVTESGVQTSGGEGKNAVNIADQRKAQRAEIRKIESNPHHTHEEISAAKAKLAKMY